MMFVEPALSTVTQWTGFTRLKEKCAVTLVWSWLTLMILTKLLLQLPMLGICYDTEEGINGTWYLREDKLANIILMLEKAIEGEESSQRFIKTLCGKLIHIRCLIRHSKYMLSQIIIAANETDNMEAICSGFDRLVQE